MELNNRNDLRILRTELKAKLAELGDEHGVKFKLGNFTFDRDGNFVRTKLEANPAGYDADAEYFKANAHWVGLSVKDLGAHIRARGERFRITGLRPRGKYRVIAKGEDSGRVLKFTVDGVVRQLSAAR